MKYVVALSLMAVFLSSCVVAQTDYTKLVPLPGDLTTQNGQTYLKQSTMMSIFGAPCDMAAECTSPTNSKVSKLVETASVGEFRVTGLTPAVDALRRALAKVKADKPDLYKVIGTAGMLCCRAVRGSSTSYSNHAWGSAVDFTIDGVLDPRSDAKTQLGLLELYPYMSAEGFYWAAGYSAKYEDAMHFEISEQTMEKWQADGTLTGGGGSTPPSTDPTDCKWPTISEELTQGMNANVFVLQHLLQHAGATDLRADGLMGGETDDAIRAFQRKMGLDDDGIVGGKTWHKLFGDNVALSTSSPASVAVKAVQSVLNRKYGYRLVVDGDFGSATEQAVKTWQEAHGLTADGIVGISTFKGLLCKA